jgi:ATP-dependent DNA helicase 2 subunit 2
MGEVTYIWGDPGSPIQQIALSSLVQAMSSLKKFAVARYIGRDGADPKMVVLAPSNVGDIDCLLMVRMPFADDVRKYTFASLDVLVNKKGERVVEHPYIPTEEQVEAMDDFVDAMDLSTAGEKDEDG